MKRTPTTVKLSEQEKTEIELAASKQGITSHAFKLLAIQEKLQGTLTKDALRTFVEANHKKVNEKTIKEFFNL